MSDIMMIFKDTLRKVVRRLNYDVVSYDPRFNMHARKAEILQRNRINTVIDVGANVGQFGLWLRSLGFKGRIISFEPIPSAFRTLELVAKKDGDWHAFNFGLGERNEERTFFVSKNSFSSSLLRPSEANLSAHAEVSIKEEITISVRTLDSLAESILKASDHVMLKLDTQGYEREVLAGAVETVSRSGVLLVELSLEAMYQGQPILCEMLPLIFGLGFKSSILEPCDEDYRDLKILQMDGWFVR